MGNSVLGYMDSSTENGLTFIPSTKLTSTKDQYQGNPLHHPGFSTLLKEIPLDQILISMYSTMYSHSIFIFLVSVIVGLIGECCFHGRSFSCSLVGG